MATDHQHRFSSKFGTTALIDAVELVARHASPTDPARCSGPQFNAARADAGHPDLPTAGTIARRLRCPWAELLAVSFDPGRNAHHHVALRGRDTRATELTLHDAVAAVRQVAAARAQTQLARSDFDETMTELRERERRRRRPNAALPWLYPSAAAIDAAVGWETALARAGLSGPYLGSAPGVSRADALERFLTEHGYLVGEPRLLAWAATKDISLAKGSMRAAQTELRERRAVQGLWTPPRILRETLAPVPAPEAGTTSPPATPAHVGPRAQRNWTSPQVRTGLLVAAEQAHRERRKLTQRNLKEWAKHDRRIPGLSTVDRAARAHGATGGVWLKEIEREYGRGLRADGGAKRSLAPGVA